jgi:hypothetical protein
MHCTFVDQKKQENIMTRDQQEVQQAISTPANGQH